MPFRTRDYSACMQCYGPPLQVERNQLHLLFTDTLNIASATLALVRNASPTLASKVEVQHRKTVSTCMQADRV